MVGLEVIRKDMEALLEQDKSLNAIEVNADSLDEALADAATQLDTRVVNLEYEILEKGSDGFLGLAKKPWKLRIYQNAASLAKKKKSAAQDIFSSEEFDEEVKIVDQDGLYYIRHFGDEIMLKVLLPVGRGRGVDVKDIINDARRPDTVSIEEGKIKEYAKKGTDGKDEPIGLYKHIKAGHAIMPQDGRDAYMAFNFETDPTKLKIKEAGDGKVNFKELNKIQNVVKGQPLATKIQPERGKAGKTLYGRYLEAKNGKDIKIPLGKNVELDKDGVTVIASEAGRVHFDDQKINVEPVLELESVGIKTGNIDFLGSVIVKGNVDDGYEIKATGDIEISGTVGKSFIKSERGNIIVSAGIFGHDEGEVHCGKSLWAKFIQSAKVEVEEFCIVSDSIMNSEVSAMKRIVLNGKKAQITGGHLFATEEICARNIGSPGGGTETILEVGFDPRAKHRLEFIQGQQNELVRELEDVENNILTLENYKKARRTLPKDKEETLAQLKSRKQDITIESEKISEEIDQIQEHLHELKVFGKVKAEGNVFAGVKIYIRDTLQEVRADTKNVTYFMEGGFIRTGKYEAPDLTGLEMPEGYSS